MQFRDTIIDVLERQGWLRDPRRDGWFNPTTHEFVPSERLDELDRLYTLVDSTRQAQAQVVVNPQTFSPSAVHHASALGQTHDPANDTWRGYPDEHQLKVRLGIRPTHSFPWAYVHVIRSKQRITVIIAADGGDRVVAIEDDINLFPSDELIGKLRLLQP